MLSFVEAVKMMYPKGTRVRLLHMEDPQPIEPGTLGTVTYVDDIGTIHCDWDNGRTLGLVPSEDAFEVIKDGT